MSVRIIVAGLLVGVLGILTTFGAQQGERLLFKQMDTFVQDHPEAFPLPANRAQFWSFVVTLWVGLLFGFLYSLAAPTGPVRAVILGLVSWLGFVAPILVLQFLWTRTSLYGLGATAIGYFLQLVVGGLLLTRILKPERTASIE